MNGAALTEFYYNNVTIARREAATRIGDSHHLPLSIPKISYHQGQSIILYMQTVDQIRDLMKANAQELMNEALRRAVRRDASMGTV